MLNAKIHDITFKSQVSIKLSQLVTSFALRGCD